MFQRIIRRIRKNGLSRIIIAVMLLYAAVFLTGINVNAAAAKPAAPTGLKQTAAGETSFTMEWKAVSGVEGYKVAYRAGTSGTWTVRTTTSTKTTVSNRKKDTSYQVRVCSKKDGAFGSYSSIVNAVTISKVAGLKQTEAGETSFTIAWDAVSGVQGYKVQYRAGTSGSFTDATTTSNKMTIKDLKKNTAYQVRVCAKRNNLFGEYNNVVSAYTISKVTGLKQTAVGETSITVTWTAVTGATGYKVIYREGDTGEIQRPDAVSGTSFTATGLKKNTAYRFRVCAVRGSVTGTNSDLIYAYTISKVTGIEQESDGYDSFTFSFNEVSGAEAYKCAWSTSKSGKYTESSDIAQTTIGANGLNAGASYFVKVKAKRGDMYGAYSAPIEMVTAPDDTPTISQTGATETSVTLSMKGVTGATGYIVKYAEYVTLSAVGFYSRSDLKTVTKNGSQIVLSGLKKNTSYDVNAHAFRKSSTGYIAEGPDLFMTETVYVLPPKGVITTLKNEKGDDNEFQIGWQDSPVADGAYVTLYNSAGKVVQTIKCENTNYKYANYKSCGKYKVKVRLYSKMDNGKVLYGAYSDAKAISSPSPNHTWKETTSEKPATCTTAGVRTYKCKYCGLKKNTAVKAFGHVWSGWYRKDKNNHARMCSHNNSHLQIKPHTWNKGEVITPATESSAGSRKYTCTVCYAVKTVSIPKITNPKVTEKQQEAKVTSLKTDEDPGDAVYGEIRLRAVKVRKKSIKLNWDKVAGASGYVIYGNKCGKDYKKLKVIPNGNTTTWTQKKLKKGTYYKYLAMAVANVNGTQTVLSTSKSIHIATNGGKRGNYKSVKLKNVKKNKLTLAVGKTFKVKAVGVRANKKKKVKVHRKLKYESSDSTVATVNKKGKIKALKKGTANVFVYAQNGVYKMITVTVK
ncbi:MAG: fibronectin type III domain-containing protein [Lachnospiraceae bacterium]|nr:fibronectin type III domain-containing protein [Lachnospiraceae bacterium]